MRTPEEMDRMLDWLDKRINSRCDKIEQRVATLEEHDKETYDTLHELSFQVEVLNEGNHFEVDDADKES